MLWSFPGEGDPVKMFERTANLNGNQIINYRVDPSGKWLVLIGIAPGAPEVRPRERQDPDAMRHISSFIGQQETG